MADDVTLPGTGNVVAADEIAGVKYQRVKISHGADGSATDASSASPLPVNAVGNVAHDAADSGGPVKIGGKANDVSPAAVADNDRVDASYTLTGAQRATLVSNSGTSLDDGSGNLNVTIAAADIYVGVVGNVAHDIADSGNPVKIGGKAIDVESMPAAVAAGDRVNAAYTPKGIAAVGLFSATTEEPIDTLPVSIATPVSIDAIAAGDNNIGNVDVASSALPTGAATAARQDTANTTLDSIDAGVAVSIGLLTTIDADTGGILTAVQTLDNAIAGSEMQVDVVTLPNVTLAAGTNTNEVVGDAAEDAALAGNPVRQGVRASTAVPSAMSADGDVVTPWANRNGAQVVVDPPHVGLIGDPWTYTWKRHTASSAQTGTAIWTPAGGKRIVLTLIQIGIGGTVAGTMTIWFGASGDTTYSAGTDQAVFEHQFAPTAALPPGVIIGNGAGILGIGAADDILRVTTTNALVETIVVHGYEV